MLLKAAGCCRIYLGLEPRRTTRGIAKNMSSAVRTGRRRRLLHDGATVATKDENPGAMSPPSGPRYAPGEGSASMAVAARLLPRSWWSLTAVFISLSAAVVGLVLLDGLSLALAAEGASKPIDWLWMDRPASLAAWWASTLWMGMALLAMIAFGLCRSRMDDLRCGYRWWLVAAAASVALSWNAATHAHGFLGELLAKSTGFAPLGTGAFWWLVPSIVVLGALAVRLLVGMADSRVAIGVACLAASATLISSVVEAGLVPESLASGSPLLASPLLAPVATLAGVSLAIMSLLFFARRIVLEVEGAVAPPVQKATPVQKRAKPKKSAKKPEAPAAKPSIRLAPEPSPSKPEPSKEEPLRPSAAERQATRRATKAEAKPEKEATSWVSGSDDYQDDYDESPTRRKLSKAERKRLRKQKARHAA